MQEMCAWEGQEGPDALDIKQRAMWAQSGMILDALRHATDALDYLRVLKNQSVFNFCAIPATMALATLDLCFMNSDMFLRNIKIRKAVAARLIMRSTNPREVGLIFRDYARSIHAKASPKDPSFIRISVACGKIEQWNEQHYPSFVRIMSEKSPSSSEPGGPTLDPYDARSRIVHLENHLETELGKKKRLEDIRAGIATNGLGRLVTRDDSSELLMYVGGSLAIVSCVAGVLVWLLIRFFA